MIYSQESLRDAWDEFYALSQNHWHETEMYRNGQELNPDKEKYLHYNDIGYHVLYTARDGDKMIGNCGMYITESMHTQTKMAMEDTIFLLPEYRKGGIAYHFMKFIENDLLNNKKVVEIIQSTKLNKHNASRLLEKMGFQFFAKMYIKQYEVNA